MLLSFVASETNLYTSKKIKTFLSYVWLIKANSFRTVYLLFEFSLTLSTLFVFRLWIEVVRIPIHHYNNGSFV